MLRRKIGLGIIILLVLVLGAAAGMFMWLRGSGRPQREGAAHLRGLSAAVEVRFDRFGVPHVSAASGRDLAAALGWLHANDRFFQMELGRRAVAGRLSEIFGARALDFDRQLRTLRFHRGAERLLAQLSSESLAWLDAYSAGVNTWLASRSRDLPPELRILGVDPEPWRPVDSVGFVFLMANDLSFWEDRPEEPRFLWLRELGAERTRDLIGVRDLQIPPAIAALAEANRGSRRAGEDPIDGSPGSNNWAVGPSRTAAGHALLANDPHLALRLPGTWYQALLRAPDYEASGMTLPGLPAIVLGRSARLTWAMTNVMLDDHDLFFEELNPEGKRVRRGEGWEAVVEEREMIAVSGGEPVEIVLRSTSHGPLLEADSELGLPARSLAWTAYLPSEPMAALLGLARAPGVEEAARAVSSFAFPAQNLLIADATGRLAKVLLGCSPRRRTGDGRLPSPGWDPAYGWDGLHPAAENPLILAPAEDLLVTANNDHLGAAAPSWLIANYDTAHRAERIRELLVSGGQWTPETLAALQSDVRSAWAREVIERLRGPHYEGDAARAWQVLAEWDGAMALRGPAALFVLVERELQRATFGDEAEAHGLARFGNRERLERLLAGEMSPEWFDDLSTPEREGREEILAAALSRAWQEGTRRFGDEVASWSYGEIHTLLLAHPLGEIPLLGRWFNRGPLPLPGSATTVTAFGGPWRGDRLQVSYGPSMRWVSDAAEPDRTLAVLPGGQAGHPADPHYDDQLALYLAGEVHSVAWSEEAIARATVSTLRLLPE